MIVLDRNADTFPVGLTGTPFEEVYRALRIVAATVWEVDPLVYRAGMAWGWYALHDPAALTGFRDVVVAALISAIAPMVKDTQTDAELVEYLRQWRVYTPTFPKLQAIYALFGAVVDIQPISDPESQAVLPVDDTRLAFYIRIESVDFSRPLTLAEAREIAVRATPLGSRPYPYYALETRIPCTVSPAPVGIYIRLENWETARPPAPPQQLGELVFVDASTGAVVYSVESLNEMTFAPTGYFTIDDSDDVVFVEESPYPARGSLAKNYTPNVTIADGSGTDTEIPYYSQKLYIPVVVWHDENWNLGTDYFGWDLSDSSGSVYATNNTGSSRIVISVIVAMIDATDAEVVEVKNQSDAHFHAFKWTSGGVPYWYVVDGDEDWTDDLQSDGYEEVPAVVLPTVTESAGYGTGSITYVSSSDTTNALDMWDGSDFSGKMEYDSTKTRALSRYSTGSGGLKSVSGIFEIAWRSNGSGPYYMCAKNVSDSSQAFYSTRVAECSSNQATVVTVYNSSNVAYNALKFTASGTDYYYVLDGVQSDWTDDLAGIGYHLQLDIWFALKASQSNATFGANDYWGSFVIDDNDKAILQNFGVAINQVTFDGSTYDVVSFDNPSFSFTPIGLYEGIRTNARRSVDMNNFRCYRGPNDNLVYHPQICIWSNNAYNVTCKTWLCRITKNS